MGPLVNDLTIFPWLSLSQIWAQDPKSLKSASWIYITGKNSNKNDTYKLLQGFEAVARPHVNESWPDQLGQSTSVKEHLLMLSNNKLQHDSCIFGPTHLSPHPPGTMDKINFWQNLEIVSKLWRSKDIHKETGNCLGAEWYNQVLF
jgi:hypothetical protein